MAFIKMPEQGKIRPWQIALIVCLSRASIYLYAKETRSGIQKLRPERLP